MYTIKNDNSHRTSLHVCIAQKYRLKYSLDPNRFDQARKSFVNRSRCIRLIESEFYPRLRSFRTLSNYQQIAEETHNAHFENDGCQTNG